MRRALAGYLVVLAALCAASVTGAAETAPEVDPKRIVVAEGDGKGVRFVNELEQELKASAYVVVRVPAVAFEPVAMLRTLRQARAARGILLTEDGKSVVVLAASRNGATLRVYGEYSVDRDNRLARRRQWISLVERLRVPADDDDDAAPMAPRGETTAAPAAPVAPLKLEPPRPEPSIDLSGRHTARLGVAVALGYVTGRTGMTSHLLILGHKRLTPHLNLFADALWPMVPGERVSVDGLHSRVWTFSASGGLLADLGRATWPVVPFAGATVGLQFLLAYVESAQRATSEVYRVGSLTYDLHAGMRVSLRRDTWFTLHVMGGRLTSLATRGGVLTDSLAAAWSVRTAVGLLMAL